jgi:hypothetical protein
MMTLEGAAAGPPGGIIHRRSVFEVRGHVVGRRIARGAALFLRFPRRVFFVFVVFAATAVAAAVLVSMMAVLVVVVVVVLPAVVLPVGMAFRRRVEGFRRRVRFRRVRHTIFVGVVAPSAMALGASPRALGRLGRLRRARSSSGLACERRSRSVSQRGGGVPWTATGPGAPRRANGVGGRARARFGAALARARDGRVLGATGLSAEASLARFI